MLTAPHTAPHSLAELDSDQDLIDAEFAAIIAANWPRPHRRLPIRIILRPRVSPDHSVTGGAPQQRPSLQEKVSAVSEQFQRQRSPPPDPFTAIA